MTQKINIFNLKDLAQTADYSLLKALNADPDATSDGNDFSERQVFSGHYVPVRPTPISDPLYVSHSQTFFNQLGLDDTIAHTEDFKAFFSGDLSKAPEPLKKYGWATGYALSIFGTEYIAQCPFQTGNGYGDGRAMSVFEGVLQNKRWEMQLKGGGPTPYCRGADGRAVLRSSVREFLAQEYMHALGVKTSRSLCLFVSQSETVDRPWYSEHAFGQNPDRMVSNPVAITTRVASSFLRVGQLELFARRARVQADSPAQQNSPEMRELKMLVKHIIEREYKDEIDPSLAFSKQLISLAKSFRERLTDLITNWMRVGYCQGNFNSDNCAIGGFTLDYGPFGFCEYFDPYFQPWTGGGQHFAFFNQSIAAQKNFESFCSGLKPLLSQGSEDYDPSDLDALNELIDGFDALIKDKLSQMWADKLGLETLDKPLFDSLLALMMRTHLDYTIFFRELSHIPQDVSELSQCFYAEPNQELAHSWNEWLKAWRNKLSPELDKVATQMKLVNPKYTWREWLIVPAYQNAEQGDFSLIEELKQVLAKPYAEQSKEMEAKYYQLRPIEYFDKGGVSHYSCSS